MYYGAIFLYKLNASLSALDSLLTKILSHTKRDTAIFSLAVSLLNSIPNSSVGFKILTYSAVKAAIVM